MVPPGSWPTKHHNRFIKKLKSGLNPFPRRKKETKAIRAIPATALSGPKAHPEKMAVTELMARTANPDHRVPWVRRAHKDIPE